MAIQIDLLISQFGIPFSGAYFRIANIMIARDCASDYKHGVVIDVIGYATPPQDNTTKEVEFRRYHASLEQVEMQTGETFLNKCYGWVMSQSDMIGSSAV
jgi:hypothetical protein